MTILHRACPIARLLPAFALAFILFGATGCMSKILFDMDPKFSVNLMEPTKAWPELDTMTPAELEVYEKYGEPDYFRPWYNRKGEIMNRWEAGERIRTKSATDLPKSWIYVDEAIEVQFKSQSKFVEEPLSERLTTLCDRGDPSTIDPLQSNDLAREAWIYYDVGEKYFFTEDGKAARPMQKFKPIGRGFIRM